MKYSLLSVFVIAALALFLAGCVSNERAQPSLNVVSPTVSFPVVQAIKWCAYLKSEQEICLHLGYQPNISTSISLQQFDLISQQLSIELNGDKIEAVNGYRPQAGETWRVILDGQPISTLRDRLIKPGEQYQIRLISQ